MIKNAIWFMAISSAFMAFGFVTNFHPITFLLLVFLLASMFILEYLPQGKIKYLLEENTRLKEELAITEDACKTISSLFKESVNQNEALLKLLHHWRDEALKA